MSTSITGGRSTTHELAEVCRDFARIERRQREMAELRRFLDPMRTRATDRPSWFPRIADAARPRPLGPPNRKARRIAALGD